MIVEVSTAIVTDGSGNATVYLGTNIRGRVHAIRYTPGDIDNGAGLTITGEDTGVPILTQATAGTSVLWKYPRAFPNAVGNGAAGTVASEDVHVFNERIKVAVASGGSAKTGSITAYIDTASPY
jgi:hypothetical protein